MNWLYLGLVTLWFGLLCRSIHRGLRRDESKMLMILRVLTVNNIFWGIVFVIWGLVELGFFWLE